MSCKTGKNQIASGLASGAGVPTDVQVGSGTCFTYDRQFGAIYTQLAETGKAVPIDKLPGQTLPFGFQCHNGHVHIAPIGKQPVPLISYMAMNGYVRETQVRAVEWDDLDDHQKKAVWNYGAVPYGQRPSTGVVFQATQVPTELDDNLKVDWDDAPYYATPEDAARDRILWSHIERHQDYGDIINGQPHALFHVVAAQREMEKQEEVARQQEAAARRQQEAIAEEKKRERFFDLIETARKSVVASPAEIMISVTYPDGREVQENVQGRKILRSEGRTETGLVVYQNEKRRWIITHENTGAAIGEEQYQTLSNAVGVAARISEMADWKDIKSSNWITPEVRENVLDFLRQYGEYLR